VGPGADGHGITVSFNAAEDGQPDLPSGGHAELPDGGQRDYLM